MKDVYDGSHFVADYHHDTLYPSSIAPAEIIKRANAIWARRRIKPKQHLSEQRPGAVTIMERRAHSDRCETLPADLPVDMGKKPQSTNPFFLTLILFARSYDRGQ